MLITSLLEMCWLPADRPFRTAHMATALGAYATVCLVLTGEEADQITQSGQSRFMGARRVRLCDAIADCHFRSWRRRPKHTLF